MKIINSNRPSDMYFWFSEDGRAEIVTKEEFEALEEEYRKKKEAWMNVDAGDNLDN